MSTYKKYSRRFICLCFCFVAVAGGAFAAISDKTLPVVNVTSGGSALLKFSDYVLNSAPGGNFAVKIVPQSKNNKVKVSYSTATGVLEFSADGDFKGFEIVKAEVSNLLKESAGAAVIVMAGKKKTVTFSYKPPSPAKNVFAAGEFNGWSQSATPMLDKNGDGNFTASMDVLPGSYQYKFVVDGKWIPDPGNQQKAADGFGGYNSVLKIEGAAGAGGRLFAVLRQQGGFAGISKRTDEKTEQEEIVLKYSGAAPLDATTLTILADNRPLAAKEYKYDAAGKSVIIRTTPPGVRRWFRIFAADKKGNAAKPFYFVDGVEKSDSWDDRVIYMAMVDRFYNGDKSKDNPINDPEIEQILNYQGGDLKGITEKIKAGYFNDIGVNAIWLSPVVDNPDIAYREGVPPFKKYTGYHGYWPVSLTRVEERFGTMNDLKELVDTAHSNGIKILLDVVINQIHKENPIYKEHPDWFGSFILPDGRKNLRLFDERPLDTWFDEFLPDIDYQKSPEAVNYITDNCVWWIEQTGCDGFRLDAVKHVPDVVWTELRKKISEKIEIPYGKKFYLVGESISSREKIMEYVSPAELDGQFDFPIYWAIKDAFGGKGSLKNLEDERKKSEEEFVSPGVTVSPIIGNHDFPRFIMQSGNERMRLALAFLLTLPGAPMVYYGDEFGMGEGSPPDIRRKMRFDDELTAEESKTLKFFSVVAGVRKEHPAVRYGRHVVLALDENIYVYLKQYFDDFVIVAMNLSGIAKEVTVEIPAELRFKSEFRDAFNGKKIKTKNGALKIKIQPVGCAVLTG